MEVKSVSAVKTAGFRAYNANKSLPLNLPPTTGPVKFGCKLDKLEQTFSTGQMPKKLCLRFEDACGLLIKRMGFTFKEGGKGSHCTVQKGCYVIGLVHPHSGENRQPEYVVKAIANYFGGLGMVKSEKGLRVAA